MNDSREAHTGELLGAEHLRQLSTELIERAPEAILREAVDAAKALQQVIAQKPKKVMFNGEQYLEFEDWQTLGKFYGVTVREDGDPVYVEMGVAKGFKASAVAVNRHGQILSRATAYCLTDEDHWRERTKYEWQIVLKNGTKISEENAPDKSQWVWEKGKDGKSRPKKERISVGTEPVPFFQLASMAQTRASAKALRNIMAWVAVLAGFRPTPAEEMEGLVQEEKNPPREAGGAPSGAPVPDAPASLPMTDSQWMDKITYLEDDPDRRQVMIEALKRSGVSRASLIQDRPAFLATCREVGKAKGVTVDL